MAENTTALFSDEQPAVAVGEDQSTVFRGLSKGSEVAVWASILVGVLAALAVVLRLMMPFVRRKCAKDGRGGKGKGKGLDKSSLNGSSGQLLGVTTQSTPSRSSSLSRASHPGDTKPRDDTTTISTISGSKKSSLYRNGRTENLTLPTYLPPMTSENLRPSSAVSPQSQLNTELSSVLCTPKLLRMESLNLDDTYRNNWDRIFSPNTPHLNSLSYLGHPSESRHTAPDQIRHAVPPLHHYAKNTPRE